MSIAPKRRVVQDRGLFIAVEVAVREAGKFTPSDIGVDLVRKAFHLEKGPLTGKSDEPAEREVIDATRPRAFRRQKK
jgi:hypothetical protein